MQAIKFRATIPADRTLVLHIPEGIPIGEAEIVVLVQEDKPANDGETSLVEYLDALSGRQRKTRTREDIDRQIETERCSWE